jgi:ketosteroid isomerase-like protein
MDDYTAIQQLISRYSVASTRFDLEGIVETYAADGVWHLASRKASFEGQAAIRDGLRSFIDNLDFMVQSNAPAAITIDGDTATAISVITERGKPKGSDTPFEALGCYFDDLVRTADGWRFKRRCFETITMRSLPA